MKTQTVALAFLFGLLPVLAERENVLVEDVDPFEIAIQSKPPLPKMVQTQVEFIELSHEALTSLLFLSQPKTTDGMALRKKLQDMVGKGEAKVLETQLVVCRSGQKATNESIHEFIYPTEYGEPRLPGTCGGSDPERSSSVRESHVRFPPPLRPGIWDARSRWRPSFPTTINSSICGFSRKSSGIPATPLAGNNGCPWAPFTKSQMPDFYTLRVNPSVTCVAGQYQMVSVVSPKDAKGETDMSRKVVVFVKCDVLTVK